MKSMCRSRLWVVAIALALAGCADMVTTPTRVPPDQAHFAVTGADETEDEVRLHFEGLQDRWWVNVGYSFYTLGVLIDGPVVANILGVPTYWEDEDLLAELVPKPNGSTVLDLGHIYGMSFPSGHPFHRPRIKYRFTFFDPVAELSMLIYPENDSDLTCYDRQDRVVGTDSAAGAWFLVNGESRLTVPYVEQTLKVAGAGITRCELEALGGAIDDIRFRRSSNELNLTCTGDLGENRVTRGEELSCEASGTSEEDQVVIESWSFTGADSRGQPYRFPDDVDGPITDNPWRGKMAISGTVTVSATVNGGESQKKSVPVTVEARDWTAAAVESTVRRAEYAEFLGNPDLPPSYPANDHHLGVTFYGGEYPSPQEPGVLEFINDFGPNHYLAFLARVPVELDIAVIVHPEMNRGSTFYRRQPADARNMAQGAPCVQARFDRYVERILAHEGYPSATSQSHTGVFLREYRQRAGARVENLVVPNDQLGPLAELYREKLDAVQDEADAVSDSEVDGQWPVRFECNFNFTSR